MEPRVPPASHPLPATGSHESGKESSSTEHMKVTEMDGNKLAPGECLNSAVCITV